MSRKGDSYRRSRARAYERRQRKRRDAPSRYDIYTEKRRLNRKRRDNADDVE